MGKTSTKILSLQGKAAGRVRIPDVFKTPLRPDVIKRAVVAIQSHRHQPQGREALAGKRRSVESLGAGHGVARVPRLRAGGQRAAFAVGTVGGRQAHPPIKEKVIVKKIPRKEMRLALCSAIAATASKETVTARGHITDDVRGFPLVVKDDLQNLKKTSEVEEAFIKIGVWPDVYRVRESRKVRAGRGKRRGRRIKQAVGPLLVIAKDEGVTHAARNIPGVDVSLIDNLNAELLAPGAHQGRLTIWTESAFKKLEKRFGEGG